MAIYGNRIFNESFISESINSKFYYGPILQMFNPKNWGESPIYNGKFEKARDKILEKINWCKTKEDIDYLRKDLSMGKTQLKNLATTLQKALDDPDNHTQQYEEMRKRNKKGLTVEKIETHLKWLDEVYRPAINEKAKELSIK